MNRELSLLATLFFLCGVAGAQTISIETYKSSTLQQDRKLRIRLPDGYETHPEKRYPLVLVLDGEYMFYSAVGAAAVLEAYEMMPEVIIVALDQNYPDGSGATARWNDGAYDSSTGKLRDKGERFKSFIISELLPRLERSYRTTGFQVIAGHSFTATYVNFFLMDQRPVFQGYIAISPYMPPSIHEPVNKAASSVPKDTFYFASTGENDLDGHLKELVELDAQKLSKVSTPSFHYLFQNYPGVNHMSVVNRSMEEALGHVFGRYSTIGKTESKRADFMADPLSYIQQKYADTTRLYGVTITPRERDVKAARRVLTQKKDWERMKQLAEFTLAAIPESGEGDFMLGEYFEETARIPDAIVAQEKGCKKLDARSKTRKSCEESLEELKKSVGGGGVPPKN